MPIDALPPAPQPTDDTATFNAKAFALIAALAGFVTQANALGAGATADAAAALAARIAAELAEVNAEAAQTAAQTAAAQSAQSAGAAPWVAATNYATGTLAASLVTGLVYRRKAPGGVTATDPASDPTNWWLAVISAPLYRPETGATATGEVNVDHGLRYAGAQNLNMPAPGSLAVGDILWVRVENGRTDNYLTLNGAKVNGETQADDRLNLNDRFAAVCCRWTGATYGWSI
jgi:hypothetical protein